jgi:hypothetical protein
MDHDRWHVWTMPCFLHLIKGKLMIYKALNKKLRISLNNIYFVKLAKIIYKYNTSLHECDSETSNILIYICYFQYTINQHITIISINRNSCIKRFRATRTTLKTRSEFVSSLRMFPLYMYTGTCLIQHTKILGKWVSLYKMSEFSGFTLVNRIL